MAANADVSRILVVALLAILLSSLQSPSNAAGGCTSATGNTSVSSAAGSLVVGVEQAVTANTCSSDTAVVASEPPRDSDLDALCVREAISRGVNPFIFCDLPASPGPAELAPGLVAAAFRRLPLPASVLVVQPPGGRTLVNFETNFYTENGEFTRSVRLLGRRVVLRIWPAAFVWRYGDGAVERTTTAGSPYPDLEITHRYLAKGRVAPRVDTVYAARFRVDGGPWRDVDGTVTIPGSPQGLRVVTARPVLVGG